ncbi:hypothetical protein SAMN04487936_105166 [Halobacillus dabanensis]|uniref:Coat F domain-containing protein n=1 Tax=Halobacillus dabanensis TaxID=240302 RepID=A0A1I3V5R2_HALDA|nr:hypothetical protein [Halobacillus dabanensis]SFJ90954.1 hypothetical protein SAMN04487936_105166 [Halobacillus dabanensis]
MSQNELEDFLYHLKKYMEYTTEMRAAFEHLSDEQQRMIVDASPTKEGPETISKHAYAWHDELFNRVNPES